MGMAAFMSASCSGVIVLPLLTPRCGSAMALDACGANDAEAAAEDEEGLDVEEDEADEAPRAEDLDSISPVGEAREDSNSFSRSRRS
jgi:hypothetical protein